MQVPLSGTRTGTVNASPTAKLTKSDIGVTHLIDSFTDPSYTAYVEQMEENTLPHAGDRDDTPDTLEEARITVKEKWQGAVNEGSGFVAVPMSLLRLQSQYKLSPTDMLVLINLLAHWWDPKRGVFPRSTTIAKRMGVDLRTVQRATRKLERSGLLERSKMSDGKRIFIFDTLAKRLAHDMPLAFSVQGQEHFGS